MLLERNLFAQELSAGIRVTSTGFRVESLSTIGTEPSGKRLPCVVDVIRNAICMGTRVVGVEVLVNIEDQASLRAIGVCNFVQGICRTIRDEGLSGCPVVSWEKYELRSSTLCNISNVSYVAGSTAHPACLIAVTAAWTDSAHKLISGTSCGSFMLCDIRQTCDSNSHIELSPLTLRR